jgi:hypothetical protein
VQVTGETRRFPEQSTAIINLTPVNESDYEDGVVNFYEGLYAFGLQPARSFPRRRKFHEKPKLCQCRILWASSSRPDMGKNTY